MTFWNHNLSCHEMPAYILDHRLPNQLWLNWNLLPYKKQLLTWLPPSRLMFGSRNECLHQRDRISKKKKIIIFIVPRMVRHWAAFLFSIITTVTTKDMKLNSCLITFLLLSKYSHFEFHRKKLNLKVTIPSSLSVLFFHH